MKTGSYAGSIRSKSMAFDMTITFSHADAATLLQVQESVIVGDHSPDIRPRICYARPGDANFVVVQTSAQWPFERKYFYSLGAHAIISRWEPDLAGCITEIIPASPFATGVD